MFRKPSSDVEAPSGAVSDAPRGAERPSWEFDEGAEIAPGRVALKPLGGGSMYEVYLVWDEQLHAICVAKIVRPDQVEDEHVLKELAAEAAALERLAHPVIVRGFAAVPEGAHPHLLIEHLEGPSLRRLIKRGGPLPLQQLLPLALSLSGALHYIAQMDIVHLDVKPDNIIVGVPPRLIDLSIARTTEKAKRVRKPLGTDAYMAPEQCAPERLGELVGPPADVWGLGATLHHAFFREQAFPAGEGRPRQRGPAASGSLSSAPSPSLSPSAFPRGLRSLLDSMLEPEPRRPPDRRRGRGGARTARWRSFPARWRLAAVDPGSGEPYLLPENHEPRAENPCQTGTPMEPVSLTSGRLRAPLLRLQSDDRLARLAADGSDSAFELLVRRHRPALQRASARILSGPAAEDAVQQALLSAHQALRRNGAPERFEPWLHQIAVNAALKELRRSPEDLPLDEERTNGVEQPPESQERRETLQQTIEAISGLPARQRRALVLRELEGRSHDEIARSLGLSQGAVRQLIHRARSSVRSAVSAVTPYALLLRVAGTEGNAPFGDLVGSGAAGAVAAKALVAALLAGGVAGGVSLAPEGKRGKADGASAARERPNTSPGGSTSATESSRGQDDNSGHGTGSRLEEGRDDNSGPSASSGSGSGDGRTDHSGPGGGGSDSSGPGGGGDSTGSGASGSGSSGSGSSGSGSSGSGSSGSGSSGSGSSGSGSSGSGSGSSGSGPGRA